ncbi:deoxyguanosinetriphosphate triphosphohydrolase [Tissierella carlieri]|jgi:dGTPase|uniref:deoxyguanosinetriphosphate triphosphohydrolase n=1 Tax=Tissierella TaxID=41273 RepID=UPI000BA1120F|nr:MULTISPECIES: deoxyguanosinetriphosphate triphosphohydrolase [Tissierella]MBU5313586.1 deoxyguanosinetriphosphate triphosphohydrolase [Tissierella carlieri]MDU5080552.1 deoxyguanosinetriphosphate triphosphohydrolase [Bacillota bacterium]OZV13643.1 deoxyguanosinetriphosphate triphosphohydrolase [Tissierella sp. P1]
MNIRLRTEEIEKNNLSQYAMHSQNSKGREKFEEKCDIRTDFQRDRDRIIHSKSFRRLKHKTQVFIAPEGDHFRTRLTHTLEVAQIGRTLARALRLNEDLVEAIALGHDLGHTPFGHTGERVLNKLHPKGFNHNEQSIRVVDFLEHKDDRIGLNLTYEVKEGIRKHSGDEKSQTLEGQVVKYADRIAYINHDIDDAIRAGVIRKEDLPEECVEILGKTHGERINTMILDIIKNSMEKNTIIMSADVGEATNALRNYMFQNVYLNQDAKSEESKAEYVLEQLYIYYLKNINTLPEEHLKIYKNMHSEIEDIICDYIAGTTDRYAVNLFNNIFIPKPWQKY